MVPNNRQGLVDMEKKVFDIRSEPMPRGAWWWWFWLFFFDNPKNPAQPQQLMVLWSTKNEKKIDCNGLRLRMGNSHDRSKLDGVVASWYFDGNRMHHNFILERCGIKMGGQELRTESATPTSFTVNKDRSTIKMGDGFEFVAEAGNKHAFEMPTYHSRAYFGDKGYSIIKLNHMDLSGRVNGEQIHGSAYFQRVFISAPSPSWYWGVFHFENGGILTYFNPYVLGKSIKKDVSFFDGRKMHTFDYIDVERTKGDLPTFIVSGRNAHERIRFTVAPYSLSSWTFRKKALSFIPNKLVYNEYPAVISGLEMDNWKTGERIVLDDLGKSVGNAEHTTGFLL